MFKRYFLVAISILLGHFNAFAQLKIGQDAPEIVITDWLKNVPKSKGFSGKFIIIDFWATWCAPCLETVPHFNQIVKENRSNSDLIFLSLTEEKVSKVIPMLKRIPFSSIVVTDTSRQTYDNFMANAIPFCVVIDNRNKIRWFGHSGSINSKIISSILGGKPVDSEEKAETSISTDTDKLYDNLYDRYAGYFDDEHVKEYFSMGPVTSKPLGSVRSRGGVGKFPYKEMVIGYRLVPRISTLLDIGTEQIVIPKALQEACISYCYKSELKNNKKNILDTILYQLNLKYAIRDSLLDVISLEIENRNLLVKFASDSLAHMSRSSSSDSYAAIEHHDFSELTRLIQEKVKKVVIVQPDPVFTKKFSLTVKFDNLQALAKSLRYYGIKLTIVKLNTPVYRFEEIE
ncbi:TlpA family protein disulfide reductase [Pedobacter sp. 22226]|uniref:TlpA family protein disulfide reductase n=1 Tax=Pedobacter sp. 22226 TaxID=3453894 RepID=UPI003F862A3C